jgi:hypothetical protein
MFPLGTKRKNMLIFHFGKVELKAKFLHLT